MIGIVKYVCMDIFARAGGRVTLIQKTLPNPTARSNTVAVRYTNSKNGFAFKIGPKIDKYKL